MKDELPTDSGLETHLPLPRFTPAASAAWSVPSASTELATGRHHVVQLPLLRHTPHHARVRPDSPITAPYARDAIDEQLLDFEEFTAIHEAGHAVVAYVCGWPIRLVTIEPDPSRGAAGRTATWFGDGEADLTAMDLPDQIAARGADTDGAGSATGTITASNAGRSDQADWGPERMQAAFAPRVALYRQFSPDEPECTFFCDLQLVAAAGHEACVCFVTGGYDYWTETERADRATLWAAARCMARMTGGSVLAVRSHWTLQSGRLIPCCTIPL